MSHHIGNLSLPYYRKVSLRSTKHDIHERTHTDVQSGRQVQNGRKNCGKRTPFDFYRLCMIKVYIYSSSTSSTTQHPLDIPLLQLTNVNFIPEVIKVYRDSFVSSQHFGGSQIIKNTAETHYGWLFRIPSWYLYIQGHSPNILNPLPHLFLQFKLYIIRSW